MNNKPRDLGDLPANYFFEPVRGRSGSMASGKVQEWDARIATHNIERRKKGVRRALDAAPIIREPIPGVTTRIREAQAALVKSLGSEWGRLLESTQDLLLDAVAGLVMGHVTHRDYASALMAAKKELRGPPTAPPRRSNHAAGYWPHGSGW